MQGELGRIQCQNGGLADESGLEHVRISSFGYDPKWSGPHNVLDIAGFSGQLLDSLDLHYATKGDVRLTLRIC